MDVNFPRGTPLSNLPNFRPLIAPLLIVIMVLAGLGTTFYQVDPDEMGVVQRFGKYVRTTRPGLRMKIPFGIETVLKVKVTHVFKEEFGFRTVQPGIRSEYNEKRIVNYDKQHRPWFQSTLKPSNLK